MRGNAKRPSGDGRRVGVDVLGGVLQDLRRLGGVQAGRADCGDGCCERRHYRLWAGYRGAPRRAVVPYSGLLYSEGARTAAATVTGTWCRGRRQDTDSCEDRDVGSGGLARGDDVRRKVDLLGWVARRWEGDGVRCRERQASQDRLSQDYRGVGMLWVQVRVCVVLYGGACF